MPSCVLFCVCKGRDAGRKRVVQSLKAGRSIVSEVNKGWGASVTVWGAASGHRCWREPRWSGHVTAAHWLERLMSPNRAGWIHFVSFNKSSVNLKYSVFRAGSGYCLSLAFLRWKAELQPLALVSQLGCILGVSVQEWLRPLPLYVVLLDCSVCKLQVKNFGHCSSDSLLP